MDNLRLEVSTLRTQVEFETGRVQGMRDALVHLIKIRWKKKAPQIQDISNVEDLNHLLGLAAQVKNFKHWQTALSTLQALPPEIESKLTDFSMELFELMSDILSGRRGAAECLADFHSVRDRYMPYLKRLDQQFAKEPYIGEELRWLLHVHPDMELLKCFGATRLDHISGFLMETYGHMARLPKKLNELRNGTRLRP